MPSLTAYAWQPWPKGAYKRYRAVKACQRNAYMLALDHPGDLRLVKGYALTVPANEWVGHWWCVDEDGRVVDPTWKNRGQAYVGVEVVDVKAYSQRIVEAGFYDLEVETFAPREIVAALDAEAALRPVR